MTLTARLSGFVLALLGVVLIAFSASVWWFARLQLERELDDRVQPVLDALMTATEAKLGGVTWEPPDGNTSNGGEWPTSDRSMVWLVVDEQSRELSQSSAEAVAVLRDVAGSTSAAPLSRDFVTRGAGIWRVTRVRLSVQSLSARPNMTDEGDENDGEVPHPTLVIVAGASWSPMATKLRTVGVAVSAVTLLLWSLALIVSRSVCRRALAPVTSMAAAARDMRAAGLSERLPVSETHDELEDLGRSFNGLLNRLQDSFERQRRFTGDASHQLRTPLTVMLGHLEVTMRRDRTPDEYRQTLAIVVHQTEHLRDLVESLLVLARADEESQRPPLVPLDLCEWLPEFIAGWAGHPRAADMRLEWPSAAEPLVVSSHAALLTELLKNLLDNATKYSPAGTPITISVEPSLSAIGSGEDQRSASVRVHITDHGPGISADDLPHLFEPFYRSRVSLTAMQPGSGLGLAIAHRIADVLSGSLSAVSPSINGLGSRFTVTLPVATEPREQRR